MMIERRRERRMKSYLGAKLTFNHRQSVIDCLIRNISPAGRWSNSRIRLWPRPSSSCMSGIAINRSAGR